jgi:hypothetical protein
LTRISRMAAPTSGMFLMEYQANNNSTMPGVVRKCKQNTSTSKTKLGT